ncbi:MAG TPA: HD domain-containing protein, partial [Candidatus Omnitrophota bacterium]|nr:HD domain-containing protein [Candidatus Omnitrophota bacterium]
KGAINFAKRLAKRLKAGFVILDREHGACRLVKRLNEKTYTLDFTDFRGNGLKQDLLHRDFTINTLTVELEKIFISPNLSGLIIDPYSGREDLKKKLIRVVNKRAFDEDPLRILRAFSLSSIFAFKIDKDTLRLIRLKKQKLARVSSERIRDELFKLFDAAKPFVYLKRLDELKALKVVFPEVEAMRAVGQGPYHHLDVLAHSLETLRQLEALIIELKNNKEIQDYLNEVISSERRRRALMKMAALLHDIGKPAARRREDGKIKFHGHERIGLELTEDIAKRLRLSNDEIDALKKIVLWHLRPGYLADNDMLTPRAIFRYFRDTQKEAVSTLLISLADQRATRGPLTSKPSRLRHERLCFTLIKEYFKRQKEKKLARLINGNDLIKKFNLQPSPLFGKILREIEELQAIGKVRTKREALETARKFINDSKP